MSMELTVLFFIEPHVLIDPLVAHARLAVYLGSAYDLFGAVIFINQIINILLYIVCETNML